MVRWATPALLMGFLVSVAVPLQAEDLKTPLAVGDQAPDVTWQALKGPKVQLSALAKKGPVVLVVLRGYPGYQCPLCTRQVGELLGAADELAKTKANVVLVYPGPRANLKQRAAEFYQNKTIPDHFHLVLDPDLKFTKQYGLWWNAPRETAYPSTFVIDSNGKVTYALISDGHGGRSKPSDVLKAIPR